MEDALDLSAEQATPAIGGLRGFWKLAKRFLPYALPYRDKLLLRVVVQAAKAVLGILGALAVGKVVDSLTAGDSAAFVQWATLALACEISGLMLLLAWASATLYVRLRVDLRLKRLIFDHTQRMSLAFHESRPIGENMFRINNDTSAATDLAINVVPELFERLFPILTATTVLLALNPVFVLLIAVYIVLHFLFSQWVMGYGYRLQADLRVRQQRVSAILQEGLSAYAISKAMARERHELRRFYSRSADFMRSWLGYYLVESLWTQGTAVLQEILRQPAYMLLCGALVLSGKITVGDYVALQGLIWMVLTPLILIVHTIQRFRVACVPAQRMLETLDVAPAIQDAPGAVALTAPQGRLEFDYVSFRYRPEGPDVVKDLSFVVEPGTAMTLVGVSGSGKTSIFNLLMRFAEPTRGRILIDGLDLRDLRLESYLGHVGIVLQDNFLFSATIRDNILLGRPDATDDQLSRAVERAGLLPMLEQLPDGLDTKMLEGGNLSAGQRQRIAIARAIIREPHFLFLDEATAALDPVTESGLLRQLEALEKGRTRIAITHHVASVRPTDLVLVMEDGVCVQRGRHEELLAVDGAYRRLWAAEQHKVQMAEAPAGLAV